MFQIPSAFSSCKLCPRMCGVDRASGKVGVCGESARLRVGSIVAHFGEEPPISGTNGSGTVFFTGCSTGCFFCQNHQLSISGIGKIHTAETLCSEIMTLVGKGVHNVNFVTPDHFWPYVKAVCAFMRNKGIDIPFVMNSSGYHEKGHVPEWSETISIFLPDYKYADAELSKYCIGAGNYPEKALESLKEMVERVGFLDVPVDGSQGVASFGVLVRHLVLPGQIKNSLDVLNILYTHFGSYLPVSVMSQYRPTPFCCGKGSFDRKLAQNEYETVLEEIYRLGFSNVLIQPLVDEESGFVPDFTQDQPFEGNVL